MRVKRTLINASTNIASQIILLAIKLVVRLVLIKTVGIDYLGLDGLFVGVVGAMSIAEVGFGQAITTILYKPVAENDQEKIKTLVRFCQKIYWIIACAITLITLILVPFIHYIIKDNTFPLWEIRLYFVLFAISSCITYLNYHKVTLLITDQKQYIEKLVFAIVNVILGIFQIIVLLIFKNYLGFILLRIIAAFFQNLIVALIASKKYPYLKSKQVEKLASEDSAKIKKNISALVKHRIGGIAVSSSENIVISAFIGITMVALYSNYSLIIVTTTSFLVQIFSSAYASIGNLWVTSNKENVLKAFKNLRLAYFWLYSVLSIGLFVCFQPFITLWIGSEFLLDPWIVLVLCLNVYLVGMRGVVNSFKDTIGLFYNDRYKPFVEAIVHLTFSLLLVNLLGLIGVFIATLISTVTVCVTVEPYILYKKGFQKSPKFYYVHYILTFLLFIATAAATYFLCLLYPNGIWGFILRFFTCIILPSLIYLTIFFKTEQFNYYLNLLKKILNRKRNTLKFESSQNSDKTGQPKEPEETSK